MKMKGFLFAVIISLIATSGWAADPIQGNGVLTTEKTVVGDFNEIRINGPMAFEYEQTEAASPAVEVTLDENLYPHLQIEVKNRILTIEFKKVKVEKVTQFKVKAQSAWLKEARLAGNASLNIHTPLTGDEIILRGTANCLINCTNLIKAGTLELITKQSANMVIDDIDAEILKCDMDGSGSIRIKEGKVPTGKYAITGNSDLHAYEVEITDLTCKITGSGLAEVYATENLKANVIGSGTITYKGSPSVTNAIIGKGSITKIKE